MNELPELPVYDAFEKQQRLQINRHWTGTTNIGWRSFLCGLRGRELKKSLKIIKIKKVDLANSLTYELRQKSYLKSLFVIVIKK